MPINALKKGKAAEREVINKILQPIVDNTCDLLNIPRIRLARNLQQSDNGGYDIIGLDMYAIEVKRQENLALNTWWKQTLRQAGKNQIPILIYRQNNKAWRVQQWGNLPVFGEKQHYCRVDVALDDFKIMLANDLYFRFKANPPVD